LFLCVLQVVVAIREAVTKYSCKDDDSVCGALPHSFTQFHVAYTHGILTTAQLNQLEGLDVQHYDVLGKKGGKLHEAENKLHQVHSQVFPTCRLCITADPALPCTLHRTDNKVKHGLAAIFTRILNN